MRKLLATVAACVLTVLALGCGSDNVTATGEGDAQLLRENPRAHRYDKDDDVEATPAPPAESGAPQ